MENSHVTEVASLMEGDWSCYKNGQFNGGNGPYRGGQFNGWRIVLTEVVSLMEGKLSCLQRWLI